MENVIEQSCASMREELTTFDHYRTKEYELTDQPHQKTLLTGLARYCENEQFSDIKIIVSGTEFNCHRIILGASCPYFRALFEHQSEHSVLTMNEITASGFDALRRYMYTGKISLTEEIVEDIFVAADFLQFRDLVEISAAMLLQHLRVSNCLRIMHLADGHSCQDLLYAARQFTLAHFQQVVWTDDFTNLPLNSLLYLLQHEYCNVDSECVILVAICRWLSAHKEIEQMEMDMMLKSCNMSLVEDTDVQMCADSYTVLQRSPMIQERLSRTNPCDVGVLGKVVEKRKKEVVVVIVKRTFDNIEPWPAPRQVITQVIFYDPFESRWIVLTEFPCEDRDMYSAAVLQNDVYITGGVLSEAVVFGSVTNETWRYQTERDEWAQVMPMLKQRKNHGAATLHDKLFVIGGAAGDTHRLRRDGEVYNPLTDQWTLIRELLDIGGIGNPAVVPLNGRIYVIGGICSDRVSDTSQSIKWRQYPSAQCYDPRTDEWSNLDDLREAIQSMNLKPAGNECLSYLGFIIFVDEDPYTSQKRPKSLKLYNPITGKVEDFIHYSHNRFGGYTMYRDEIVKTGGIRDSFYAQNLVYSCDLSQDCPDWVMWPPMPCRSSHHSCFTLFLNLPS